MQQQTVGEPRLTPRFGGFLIRHACGHQVEHGLRIPPSERITARAALQRQVCVSCAKEARRHEIEDFERDFGLPPLDPVAPGQIEDARVIRMHLLQLVHAAYLASCNDIEQRAQRGLDSSTETATRLRRLKQARRLCCIQPKTSWWIKRAHTHGDDLLAHFIHRLQACERRRSDAESVPI